MKSVKFLCIIATLFSSAFASAQNGKLLGDVNGDGKLTTIDVKIISNMVIDPSFNTQGRSIADANEDGKVSMADVVNVINRLGHEIYNGHECVDLGTGVRWATCNIGASKPEECGDYFAWGEIESKDVYNWATYKWMDKGKDSWYYVNKYTVNDYKFDALWYQGTTFAGDNKRNLDIEDDAAHIKWGGEWRMPTSGELSSLLMGCTWIWTEQNGMNGYKVTGSNGNWIFLPAAGYREEDETLGVGKNANYWSKTLDKTNSSNAYYVFFNPSYPFWYNYSRYYGQSIRAVCP